MTLENVCKLSFRCSKAGDAELCESFCFPYTVLHGASGKTGLINTTGIPERYKNSMKHNLPFEKENPLAYKIMHMYLSALEANISLGRGLFLYAVPTPDNRLGTGNGKTTAMCSVLNEYLLFQTISYVSGVREILENPVYFIKAADFQNTYNAQFRGTAEMQQTASERYYDMKDRMKSVKILAIDDIAIRGVTPAFEQELTEIIDHRASEGLALLCTSNYNIDVVREILGERIASRIEGMTINIAFSGPDKRRGGAL